MFCLTYKFNTSFISYNCHSLNRIINSKTAKSFNENPDCPGWLCNITIEFGLLSNNNSVAFSPGTKDTLF